MDTNRLNRYNDNNIDRDVMGMFKEKWETEPEFADLRFGEYHLVIIRNEMGSLNGYVGVRRSHPYYGKDMRDKGVRYLRVHGGVTFADKASREGFQKKYWYIGFDTLHAWDYAPQLHKDIEFAISQEPLFQKLQEMMALLSGNSEIPMTNKDRYKDFEYITEQVSSLYEQLVEVKERQPPTQINHVREYKKLHRNKVRMNKWLNSIKEKA